MYSHSQRADFINGQGAFDSTLPVLYRWLGYLFFLAYILLAVFYFQERTLFTDAAYQAFHLIQDGQPVISHNRLGNVIPQIPAYLAYLFQADLATILLLYSISLPLFFLSTYALLTHWLKNDLLGWTLIAYLSLMTLDSFYYIQSEYYQAIPCILLVVGYLLKFPKLNRWQDWLFLLVLLALIVNYYRLAFLIFLFFWAYLGIRFQVFRHWRYLLLAVATIIFVFTQNLLFQSPYEAYKMGLFYQALSSYFPNFWEIPSNEKFLKKCLNIYYWFPVLLFVFMGIFIRKKLWLSGSFVLATLFGYIILLHYGSPNTTYRFYAELGYLPLIPMLVFPILIESKTRLSLKIFPILFSLILISRLAIIQGNHQTFEDRLDWLKTQLDCCTDGKCYQAMREDPDGLLKMHWAIPYETLLLSALEGRKKSKTLIILSDPESKRDQFEKSTLWVLPYDTFSQELLNPVFFHLQSGPYQLLNCN